MAEKLPVYVDMDGVLADFDGTVIRRLLEIDPLIDVSDLSSDFYITRRLKTERDIQFAHEIQSSRDFFRSLPSIEGAVDAWHNLEEAGLNPQVLSAPLTSNPWCVEEKLAWLDTHLGPRVADAACFDKHKWRYDGIALIDDRPEIDGYHRATWQHVLFSQAYNRHINTEYRIHDWTDLDHLAKLLSRAAERYQTLHR